MEDVQVAQAEAAFSAAEVFGDTGVQPETGSVVGSESFPGAISSGSLGESTSDDLAAVARAKVEDALNSGADPREPGHLIKSTFNS